MALFPGMKKRKAQEPFAETTFECRRGDLTIRGTEYKPEGRICRSPSSATFTSSPVALSTFLVNAPSEL